MFFFRAWSFDENRDYFVLWKRPYSVYRVEGDGIDNLARFPRILNGNDIAAERLKKCIYSRNIPIYLTAI